MEITKQVEVTVDAEFCCSECGSDLTAAPHPNYRGTLEIEPCSNCLAEERAAGKEEGIEEANDG